MNNNNNDTDIKFYYTNIIITSQYELFKVSTL